MTSCAINSLSVLTQQQRHTDLLLKSLLSSHSRPLGIPAPPSPKNTAIPNNVKSSQRTASREAIRRKLSVSSSKFVDSSRIAPNTHRRDQQTKLMLMQNATLRNQYQYLKLSLKSRQQQTQDLLACLRFTD